MTLIPAAESVSWAFGPQCPVSTADTPWVCDGARGLDASALAETRAGVIDGLEREILGIHDQKARTSAEA